MSSDLSGADVLNNRNKGHNKCKTRDSAPDLPPPQAVCFMKLVPDDTKVGDCCTRSQGLGLRKERFCMNGKRDRKE